MIVENAHVYELWNSDLPKKINLVKKYQPSSSDVREGNVCETEKKIITHS